MNKSQKHKFKGGIMRKNLKLLTVFFGMLFIVIACNDIGNNEKQQSSQLIADTVNATNDFYDDAETYELKMPDIEVLGEIINPGKIDLSKLPLRSIIIKEAVISGENNTFIGAYRYDGYSLYDILNKAKLNKKNRERFKPIIDLYVEVENDSGESVKISWGEIFYPNHLHEIIVATSVMRIVPSKTKELWELPKESKLVIRSDFLTERNISNPIKIIVKSYDKDFEVEKGKDPLFSSEIIISKNDKEVEIISSIPFHLQKHTIHTIFYGRGRGIHSTQPFTGVYLKEILQTHFPITKKTIQNGIFAVVADDGYRAVFTFSEICNRNDQSEVLLISNPDVKNNGIFSLFPGCDFFSDRAVIAITEIQYSEN